MMWIREACVLSEFWLLALGVVLMTSSPRQAGCEPQRSRGFERTTFWFVQPTQSQAEVEARAEALARSGIDGVIIGGGRHHYLYDDLPTLDDYVEAARLVVSACHKRGIKVAEHHSAVLTSSKDRAREHANWIQRDFESGEPSVWPEYQTYAFCPNNPDFREDYWRIAKELVQRTGADALMSDDAVFHHGCCCESCARRWREEVGGDLRDAHLRSRTPGSGQWRKFNAVRRLWHLDFRSWLRDRQAKELPETLCLSLAGSVTSPWGTQTHGGSTEAALDTANICLWEIYNPADFYSWRRLGVEAAVIAEAARVRNAVPVCLPYADTTAKRDIVDEQEEVFMWGLARSRCMPFAVSRVFLTGLTANDPARDYFLFERDRLSSFLQAEPAAAVGVVFSHSSRDVDPKWESSHTVPALGWAESLQDDCVPWRAVTEETLEHGLPADVRVLISPSAFALSDATLGAIEDFVRAGGTLIACGATAVCDEHGEPALAARRQRLERLLGVRIESVATGGNQASVVVTTAVESRSYSRFLENFFGKGRVLYAPSDLGAAAFQDWVNPGERYSDPRDKDVCRALAAMASELAVSQPVTIARTRPDARVLATLYRQRNRLLVFLLNCSGADISAGRRIPVPSRVVWGPTVDLVMTFKSAPAAMRLVSLDREEDVSFSRPGKTVTLRSPRRFGVLVVDY
jgi:hypothetical protein